MPRLNRNHITGSFCHVTQRGNHKHRIFFNDEDKTKFCLLMQEGTERFGHKIHAYCLMDNHFHLLIQTGKDPIGKAMQNLTFRFAKRLNKKFKTTGHRFQGRYFSSIVDTDAYLIQLLKYIHLNPVKAKMVENPGEYYWSTHNFYLNKDKIPWVSKDFCLRTFSSLNSNAVAEYSEFMEVALPKDIIEKIENPKFGNIIGDDDFAEKVYRQAESQIHFNTISIDTIVNTTCDVLSLAVEAIYTSSRNRTSSKARRIIGYIILHHTHHSLSMLARRTCRSVAAISKATKNIQSKLAHDVALSCEINKIVAIINKLTS